MELNHIAYFSHHVTVIMEKRGFSRAELADAAKVSVSFVGDIVAGRANPSLRVMSAISKALNVPLPLLLLNPKGDDWSGYF